MFKRIFRSGWFLHQSRPWFMVLLLVAGAIANTPDALAQSLSRVNPTSHPAAASEIPVSEPTMTEQPVQQSDPLNSPYPVPWNWVLNTHAEVSSTTGSGVRYYRSPSLVSPDGEYAAYSRIQMHVQPQLWQSRVNSVMFVENLQTGNLQNITAASPVATHAENADEEQMAGTITMIIPVSWTQKSDRLLARQFEGIFNTSDLSDYAVVWNRQSNQTTTIAPHARYTHAVLLGWSRSNSQQIVFRAGNLGDPDWPRWAVHPTGETVAAQDDEQTITFGRTVSNIWSGPQAQLRFE